MLSDRSLFVFEVKPLTTQLRELNFAKFKRFNCVKFRKPNSAKIKPPYSTRVAILNWSQLYLLAL